ncbi:hypothetical protein L1887_42098 [Cichorium endivia]|nr:hypothetical protein L1887_42098 [Cichorium endivia]
MRATGGDLEVIFRRLERRARNKFNITIRCSRFSHPSRAELEWIGMITVPLPPAQQAFGAQLENVDKIPVFLVRQAGIATPIESGCRLELGIWLCCCRRSGAVKACTIPPSFSSPNRRAPAVPSSRLASSSSSTTISTNTHPHRASWLAADMSMQTLDLLI